jgi:uncharacterized repeat protein (TIGR01451 family)
MKAKFYSLRSLFFTLLLLFSIGETINAQTIEMMRENETDGGDGTTVSPGQRLIYYIVVINGPATMNNATVTGHVPAGTIYVQGSTTVNGVPVADINNAMPFVTGRLIGTAGTLNPNDVITIQFKVDATANSGTLSNDALLQGSTISDLTADPVLTIIINESACDNFYTLTTSSRAGGTPTNMLPYQYIRELDPTTGTSTTNIFYNGPAGACKNAYTLSNLPAGSVLTDAAAMAMHANPGRIFFVNKPVNNVPADLCYVDISSPSPIAYKFVGTPLTQNTTSPITRMTFDAFKNGYAITDNGQEFIRFGYTFNGSSFVLIIDPPATLINDAGNGAHDVLAETGGDVCAYGNGLLLIPNSGNVYRIDPVTKIAKYLGTITNMPAAGCNSVFIDNAGIINIGGFYSILYKLTLSTLTLTSVSSPNIYSSSDFANCTVPPQPARIATNENAIRNQNGTVQRSGEVFAKVQPNPFKKMLNVQVQLNTAESVKIRLIDFYGRTVYAKSENLSTGSNSLNITVPEGLGSGMYVLELWAGNNRLLQKKILKQ